MFHYVARARVGSVLFRSWEEGLRLFHMFHAAFPELLALCIMPDHVHLLLPHGTGRLRLVALMSGYARFRCRQRPSGGTALWEPTPEPEAVSRDKERRNIRYVHLNPCRKGLVGDPLAWPLSTHRDFVGLDASRGSLLHARPQRFHAYVSGDPSVSVEGTALPEVRYEHFDFFAVRDAVSAVLRVLATTRPRGPSRSLLVRTAAAHGVLEPGGLGVSGFAAALGMSRSQVHRLAAGTPSRGQPMHDPVLAAAVRVVGDPRFGPLLPGDLLRLPGWAPYRGRR